MFFRMPRFIRRFIRNRTNPMEEPKAYNIRSRLALLYMFVAWNAGGYCIYQISKGNKSWPKTAGIRSDDEDMVRPAMAWAAALGVPKASVIRVSSSGNVSDREEFEVDYETNMDNPIIIPLPKQEPKTAE